MEKTNLAYEKQLEFLNDRMKDVSSTANQFLAKFFFGGIIAVIGVLNLDLVLVGAQPGLNARTILGFSLLVLGVIFISRIYFRTVYNHYDSFRGSHRKLKYKYELTLHAILCDGDVGEYARFLEMSLDIASDRKEQDEYPEGHNGPPDFQAVARYLLEHHRARLHRQSSDRATYMNISSLLVYLTLAARAVGILIGG